MENENSMWRLQGKMPKKKMDGCKFTKGDAILWTTRRVPVGSLPVEGKPSVCLICMKYRILILILIIISLGQILLTYIANTSRTHAHACANTHTHKHTHTAVAVQVSAIRWAQP